MRELLTYHKLAIIVILFCVPLAVRKIGPNGLYGFRFGRALEDERQWYDMNQVGAKCVIGALVVGILVKQAFVATDTAPASLIRYASLVDTAFFFIGLLLTLVATRKS